MSLLTTAIEIKFMNRAMHLAQLAFKKGEVPVGAVVVYNDKVIGKGFNQVETRKDATQHAELIALRQAARHLHQSRLTECDLYVTLEPCAMCAGAIIWSRIRRLVYGAKDPKSGACGSILRVIHNRRLNHCPSVKSGLMAKKSTQLLQTFFRQLRRKNKSSL